MIYSNPGFFAGVFSWACFIGFPYPSRSARSARPGRPGRAV